MTKPHEGGMLAASDPVKHLALAFVQSLAEDGKVAAVMSLTPETAYRAAEKAIAAYHLIARPAPSAAPGGEVTDVMLSKMASDQMEEWEANRHSRAPKVDEVIKAQMIGEIWRALRKLKAALAAPAPAIPDDVVRLVIAAREVAFDTSGPTDEAIKELDAASEAFASRVPWENDPNNEVDDDR